MAAELNLRIVCWLERMVLGLAVLFLFVHTLPRAWKKLNTDFPNYYMAARLVHEKYDTSRMYEWSWMEREKDHRAVDIRVIGLLPITPFSTLVIWPLAELEPLAAKHAWILLNLIFLVPIGCMLRSMAGLSYRRIALAIFLSFPLQRNLLFGQFYVFLLLLITAACFSYVRGYRTLAGILVAIAAACKVFPLLLFAFFLQRRDWRALTSGAMAGISAIALSIGVFGLNAHRTWLQEILPWIIHGEGIGTYTNTASITGVLHCLFLSEPQWNPNPWHSSPFMYALLAPSLQMLVLAPAILLIRRGDNSRERVLLEWSALLTASLAISTIPASYNFVLMVFPVCVLAGVLLRLRKYGWLIALVLAYLGIGYPLRVPTKSLGLALLLYVPRLPLMLAVLLGIYTLLWTDTRKASQIRGWSSFAWVAIMVVSVALSIRSTLILERSERQEYRYRLPLQAQGFLSSTPQQVRSGVRYVAFTFAGYHIVTEEPNTVPSYTAKDASFDELSFSDGPGYPLIEQSFNSPSQIVALQKLPHLVIEDARNPMISSEGRDLAFLRDDHGRGRLMIRKAFRSSNFEEPLTSPQLNVYEASFHSEREYAFSASNKGEPPEIFLTDFKHTNTPIIFAESRYPALSPDGHWMAYSRLDHGVWNLWLRNQDNGLNHRIADISCNQIQPAWESDSRTLLYSTDCGRSLWFTAVARRTVLP